MYNDDMMIFDQTQNRYILTEACALSLGIDLSRELCGMSATHKSNLPSLMLDRVSRTVYGYVYAHGNRTVKEERMARDDELRPIIFDALCEQLIYQMGNGDLNAVARVDTATGAVISREAMRDAAYAPMLETILGDSGLLYCGYVPRGRGHTCITH
ncbi:MAG: hypothetical protein E7663_04750 [Ruminococcaceae bacterium]|nr:hypothetical protein [Oscillospiraceae bacterium]